MHMLQRPIDLLNMRENLKDTRDGRLIPIVVPTFTDCATPGCGYDHAHNSPINPTCPDCQGLGRSATWAISQIRANPRTVDDLLVALKQAPPGSILGQTSLTISMRDKAMMDMCYNVREAYIYIDGSRFRPVSISVVGTGFINEWSILLKAYAPIATAPGY